MQQAHEGKVFWKNIALPRFMYGQEVLRYTKADMEKLRRLDNKAYRTILGLPVYTAEEFLRGEVGASSIEARDMKNKLNYYKYAAQETGNRILKQVAEKEFLHDSKWFKIIGKYMEELNITKEELMYKSKKEIRGMMDNWNTLQWRKNMVTKTTKFI